MLEDLYRIDWKKLTHAYGSAGDVPGMILALASTEKEDRVLGFELLQQNLCYQGAIYEASAYAVNYLNQLLEHPLFEEKPQLLVLLADMANGRGPLDVLNHAGLIELNEADPEIRLRLTTERGWVEETRRAVRNGRTQYLRSLAHADPEVRAAAVYLLAHLGEAKAGVAGRFLALLSQETVPQVRASLLFGLGYFAGEDEGLLPLLHEYGRPGTHALVRLAAWMSLCRANALSDTALAELVDVLSALDMTLPQAYAALPWADGHLYADIALCLAGFDQSYAPRILPDLIRVLDRVPANSAVSVAYAMLLLGFGGTADLDNISDLQAAVLGAIADSHKLAAVPRTMHQLLRLYGLDAGIIREFGY